ncbi:MAG: hypothetical protein KDA81_23230, partial [Planctomycetaceae bacterium]|nr:hypothetical protein [Planctomycetaceae bacterium]
LEVSGLASFDDERLAVSTRQGDVWLIGGAAARKPESLEFHRYATALHEPMGVVRRGGGLALVQRTELTQLLDTTGDETANEYRTLARGWGVSGNYHEYAYGPKFDGRGDLWLTLNIDLGDERLNDEFHWRGWAMKVTPSGKLMPMCAGMRSPSGLGANAAGDMFVTDQQGDWIG